MFAQILRPAPTPEHLTSSNDFMAFLEKFQGTKRNCKVDLRFWWLGPLGTGLSGEARAEVEKNYSAVYQ